MNCTHFVCMWCEHEDGTQCENEPLHCVECHEPFPCRSYLLSVLRDIRDLPTKACGCAAECYPNVDGECTPFQIADTTLGWIEPEEVPA